MKANQLKVERVLRGWSQAKVSEAVGTNVRSIIRWEQGQTLPHPYYREQLCALFGKNAKELGLLENEMEAEEGEEEEQNLQSVISAVQFPIFDPAIPAAASIAERLVGREGVLAQVKQQLWEGKGRVALHGLPGMGKTSLAVALAVDEAVRERFPDGLLWAGLGQEPDVTGHLARWGKLLGVKPSDVGNAQSREAWGNAIRAAIGSRRLLLVIDDAWSVEDALALQLGGTLCGHVLTTRLPHVAFAFAREQTQAIAELQDADGLSLLAHYVPALVEQDEESALTLVKAVGGSPLALTLMGNYLADVAFTRQRRRLQLALTKLHNVEQRLRLSAPVAATERPPCLPEGTPLSLYAAIAVSVQRLDADTYDALRTLAVFPAKPGSFSEEAALAVSAATPETLDVLWDAGLLESSGSERYTLHQTIADYAHYAGDSKAGAKDTEAQRRLVEFATCYIREHERNYEALERDESMLLAAFDYAVTLHLVDDLRDSVLGFVAFMRVRGRYALAEHLLSQALQETPVGEDALIRMQLLRALAEFANLRGEYGQAEKYSEEGLALARGMGQQREAESALLTMLGLSAYHRGEYGRARGLFEEGLVLAREQGDDVQICTLLTHLGRVLQYQGNYQEAEELYREGLKLARECGQKELFNHLLIYMGAIMMLQGQYAQTEYYYQEALTLARSLGHRELLAAVMNDTGNMALQRGNFSLAIARFEEGLALADEIGHGADRCLLLSNLATVYIQQGNYGQAEVYLREGIELARRLENRNRLTVLLTNLGCVLSEQGYYERANGYFRESVAMAHAIGSPWYIYGALMDWGECHLKYKHLDVAAEVFHEILTHEKSPLGEPELLAGAEFGLAQVALLQGNVDEALRFAQASEERFASIGHHKAGIVKVWRKGHFSIGVSSVGQMAVAAA